MIKIKKDSFLYEVAYGLFTHPPQYTNICRFCFRFVWMFLINWPIVIIFVSILFAVLFTIGFPFASRPGIGRGEINTDYFPYKKWPEIKGHRIFPIYFLLLFALYYFRSAFSGPWELLVGFFTLMITNIGLSSIGTSLGIVLLIYGFKLLSRTEAYQLTQDYLKAKKQGICPMVKFVRISVNA